MLRPSWYVVRRHSIGSPLILGCKSSSIASVSAPTPTEQHPFIRKINDTKTSKLDMGLLIMDYFMTQGYPQTAAKFAKEAGANLWAEETIDVRRELRLAIYRGDIDEAIRKLNDLDTEILDTNPSLHFALLRLQLIEIIRSCTSTPDSDITPAIRFANSQLAPRASTTPELLADLELTMTLLLALPSASNELEPRLDALLKPELRRTVAAKVNTAVLQRTGVSGGEARIWQLYHLREWSEKKAREIGKDIPDVLPLGLEGFY